MPEALPRVFISATSSDLRSYRDVAKDALLTGDVYPSVQDNFPPDYRTLVEYLEDQIRRSDAVVCLVGLVFGAAPEQAGETYRSYTQIEYDVARRLGKPIYVFLATEQYVTDQSVTEGEREALLQREHRALLLRNHKCTLFSSLQELRLRISEMVPVISRRQTTPSGSFVFLHSPLNPFVFAGRGLELKQLTEALERPRPCLVAVIGIGGQGKTILTAHWIRERQPFEFEGGLWCTANLGGFTFDMFLDAALSYFLRDGFDKLAFADLASRVQKLLILLQERRALLVIDGVERWLRGWNHGRSDLSAAETNEQREGHFEGLDEFLSGASGITSGTHVILTTRAMPAVLDNAECAVIPVREPRAGLALDGLDDEAAVGLLRSLGVRGERDEIRDAARAYANHPLALTVLGSLLAKSYGGALRPIGEVSPLKPERQLFLLLEETRENLPGGKRSDRFLQIASHCIENPTLSTLAAAMGGLKSRWRAWPAFVLGRLLHREFPGRQPEISALRELAIAVADWHLVEWDGATSAVRIHPVIKEYFASRARDSSAIHRSLADHYALQRLESDPISVDQVLPRLLAVEHSLLSGNVRRCVELMFPPLTATYSLSEWLAAWGHLSTGIALLDRLAKASKGDARAQFLIGRSAMLHQLGKSQQAVAELNEAIHILDRRGSASEEQRTNLARALANRGNVLRETGRSPDAIVDFDRAIDVFQELGSQQPAQVDLAQALVNRANALCDAGHWSRALADYDSAESIYQSMTDMDKQIVAPRLALVLANRGIVLGDLHRGELAISDFLKAIALYTDLQSAGRQELAPRLAHVRIMLGSELDESGRSAQALPHIDAARDELQRLLELGRSDAELPLALALMDRGRAHIRLENWPAALSDCNAAVSAYERLMEDGRPQLAGSLAHTLLNRAEARHASGDRQGSISDRSKGFLLFRKLIREWSGEADIRVVYVKKAAAAVKYLLPSDSAEALVLLSKLLNDVEGFLKPSDAAEALCYTAARELASLEQAAPSLGEGGVEIERIRRLRRMAQARIIARR